MIMTPQSLNKTPLQLYPFCGFLVRKTTNCTPFKWWFGALSCFGAGALAMI